jgi:Ser-tRNA(Ala) deacylase AlaX
MPAPRACVSLTYDDALPVHHELVAPLLEKHGLRATFYVPCGPHFLAEADRWRSIAAAGHELGNHTIFHPCRGARTWLDPVYDMAGYTARRWSDEVALANGILRLIDGHATRSYGNTCHENSIGAPEHGATVEPLPAVDTQVVQHLHWDRRHRHMLVHSALHLLSVVIPLPVTGGQISAEKGRLDFDMTDPPADLAALEARLNALVDADLPVTEDWITDADLAANPGLVKTMSVMPPMGQGRVRLVRIGYGAGQIDLQPCGGTHVARTGEIGHVSFGKIEKTGKQNRRVAIHLAD